MEAGDADKKAEKPEQTGKIAAEPRKIGMRRVKLPRHVESMSGSRRNRF
jgi:hypothetical protein